jgi:ABC-type Fe3+ transport system substrate-binding protein
MRYRPFSAIVSALIVGGMLLGACSPAPAAAPAKPAPAKPAAPPAAPAAPAKPASEAPAPAAAAPATAPALARLIEGAKSESGLKGQWSAASFGGNNGWNELVAGMNRKYGTNVQAQFTPGRNMQAMMELIGQEQAAGQPASTDIYMGNVPAILDATKSGVLQPLEWASFLERMPPAEPGFEPVAPGGIAISFASTVMGIIYNTNAVRGDDVPRKLDDLLLPKWKDRLATTPYAAGFRELALPQMLGRDYVVDYVRKLSTQAAGLIRCGENERISSGEFVIFAISCGTNDVADLQRRGAPIAYTVPQEGAVMQLYYAGVPKNSSSPNAAALFIAFLTSPEGQEILHKVDAVDLYTFPESQTRKVIDDVRAAGGKVVNTSPQVLGAAPAFAEVQAELEAILQQAAR